MSFAERMARPRDKARKAKWPKARAEKTVDADEDPAVFWQKFGGESDKVAKRAEAAATEAGQAAEKDAPAAHRSKVSDAAAYLTQYDIKRRDGRGRPGHERREGGQRTDLPARSTLFAKVRSTSRRASKKSSLRTPEGDVQSKRGW